MPLAHFFDDRIIVLLAWASQQEPLFRRRMHGRPTRRSQLSGIPTDHGGTQQQPNGGGSLPCQCEAAYCHPLSPEILTQEIDQMRCHNHHSFRDNGLGGTRYDEEDQNWELLDRAWLGVWHCQSE